jgi:succinate-semialdehyde dehydrogenase/glutarate-semialdehyde dehydrogenase
MQIKIINPANGSVIQVYDTMSDQVVSDVISNSYNSFLHWRQTTFAERAELITNIAKLLHARIDYFAELISCSMGKPITAARAEIVKSAWVCKHYAEQAESYLQPKYITAGYSKSFVTYNPMGVILGVMPWNFPVWQIFRFIVPTLMAGNTVIVKHADNCTAINLAIEQLVRDAGAKQHIYNSIVIEHNQAVTVIANSKVAAVTLTGSERAGAAIASIAAQHIKKCILELGGSDPYLILEDADLELAAQKAINSRLNNSGQVCIAAKRLIVVEAIANKFKQLILDKIKDFKMGDPMDEATKLGPLARADLRDNLHSQIIKSIELGAKQLYGSNQQEYIADYYNKPGFYYPVTVLDNIQPGMPAYHEELFGPCICFITVKDQEEAIRVANDSQYGLSAAIFTKNQALAEELAVTKLNVGIVAINGLVSSDPRLPFGGIKHSGYGRELGQEGILEFVNIKTVVVH